MNSARTSCAGATTDAFSAHPQRRCLEGWQEVASRRFRSLGAVAIGEPGYVQRVAVNVLQHTSHCDVGRSGRSGVQFP
jgi:hypothetical protein